nr:MAG TPA: hypothetical protein [Caudoviricetes sp.]
MFLMNLKSFFIALKFILISFLLLSVNQSIFF